MEPHIKNCTPKGVTEGIFTVLVEGKPVAIACDVCHSLDKENPVFRHAAFTDETHAYLNVSCPACGTMRENMPVDDCPLPFMIRADVRDFR